jgi:cysteinyl-tRNA synthetase
MREIRLHDTAAGKVAPLVPRVPGRVGIYACGPTVYSRIHLGNARPYVIFSLMKRFLEHEGLAVELVINVTDVNDKIYTAARAAGVASAQLAAEMTAAYVADTDALGLGRPDHEPLASETMDAIVAYIQALIDSDHAYVAAHASNRADGADGARDVFFRVRSDPGYGSLSHRQIEDMDQGEGVEGSERKQDPLDFALWKAHKADEDTCWPSPWGDGRPGWHIECSAMAEGLLGTELDIHGGGSDLIFPHHENEAAQTRAARGSELARTWVHNGMIQATGEKMAKSVGNIAPLADVLESYGPSAVVMYLISGHYRQPLSYSQRALEQAQANVNRIREAGRRLSRGPSPVSLAPLRDRFFGALADDFNTPEALSALNAWIRAAAGAENGPGAGDEHLREMLGVLGLAHLLAAPEQAPPEVSELVAERELARGRRDFAAADRLRDELAQLGWDVRDGAAGPVVVARAPDRA